MTATTMGSRRKLSKAATIGVFSAGTAVSYCPAALAFNGATNAGRSVAFGFHGGRSLDDLFADPSDFTHPSGDRVADLKAASGLTWAQIAQLFAVSSRSVHLWVAGGRMTAQHEERMATLGNRVAEISGERDPPSEVRARVLAPRGTSPSLFAAWVLEVRPRITAEGFTPGELFVAASDGPYEQSGRYEGAQKVDWPGVS